MLGCCPSSLHIEVPAARMGALKNHPSRSDVNWRAAKALKSFAGFIFVCSKSTIPDLDRGIFGLPHSYEDSVRRIQKGMPLFLFNYSNRRLYGVFEAVSNGGINLDPHAWESTHHSKNGRCANPVSKYPAQVKVSIQAERPALVEDIFRPIVDYIDDRKFRLELTSLQVQQLLSLFDAAHRSERELLIERHRDNHTLVPNHNAERHPDDYRTSYHDLESPRSASNPESDSYSDYSSHGLNSCEDEWTDEVVCRNVNHQQGNHTGLVSERLRGVDLGYPSTYINGYLDMPYKSADGWSGAHLGSPPSYINGHVDMSQNHDDPQNARNYDGQERAGKRTSRKSTLCNGSNHDNIILSRLQDNDPAVNSNMRGHMEVGVSEAVPSEMQVRYGNVIFIPVQPVQPRQLEGGTLSSQAQRPKRSNRKRHSKGSTVNTWKPGFNPSRVHKFKDPKAQNEPEAFENGVARPQKLQSSRMVVPVSSQSPDELHDQAQLASALSPLRRPSNSEAPIQQSAGARADGQGCGFGATNNIQLTPEELEHLLQNGHNPIVLMPPPMPRPTPSPQPITAGFVEALHFEILRFARWTRPSAETQLHVEAAIDCVRKGVKAVWPEADVEVFGSFATGLCLHHSDVDLAIIDAPRIPSAEGLSIAQASALLIRELAAELRKFEWCESITPLETASMPVLKCNCWPFGRSHSTATNTPLTISPINVDITIGGMRNSHFNWNPAAQVLDMADSATDMGKFMTRHTGGLAREYVLHKIQELRALAPLVLLLKSYLHHRNLSNVYTGGLGSFSLTLLVAFYLERVAVTGDGFSSNNGGSPTTLMSFPVSCSSECSDDSDAPSSSDHWGASSWNIEKESGRQSLGECFVRRAADVAKSVLSVWDQEGSPYLGTLLLGFLQSFGFELDLSCEKIILKSKTSSGGFFKRDDRHVALWIDDPLRPGVNIGAGSYNMVNVQNAFKEMLQALTKCPVLYSSLECKDQDCQDLAAISQLAHLGRLIGPADDY